MPNKLITGPASEPVTLTEAKAHLNVTHTADDTYITTLIGVAREVAEGMQWRQLLPATREQVFDCFETWRLQVEFPPLIAVSSVKYIDIDGVEQTLVEGTDYEVGNDAIYGCVYPAYNQEWPNTRDIPSAVRIRYTCGYADADSVPKATKQGILILLADWYEHREEVVLGVSVANIKDHVLRLLKVNSAEYFT